MPRKAGPTPDQVWMAELLANAGVKLQAEQERNDHICGNCRTPVGRSTIPCKNDKTGARR